MDAELISEAQQARSSNSVYSDYDTLAFVFLATNLSWTPMGADPQSLTDLSLATLIQNSNSLSVEGMAAFVLAILRDTSVSSKPSTAAYMTQLTNTLRVQGRTEYLATAQGQQNPSYVGTALGLIDFVMLGTQLPIDKMANFLAQEDSTAQVWFSSSQVAYFMQSLSIYDASQGNTNPNLEVKVSNGTNAGPLLIDAFFHSPADPSVTQSFLYEQIDSIEFSANGVGEASIVFGATFVPLNVSTSPIYQGMSVDKIIQRIDPVSFAAVGPGITSANLGETVRVTIQVTIPDYSPVLFVVDPVPGSIEPQDDNIYSEGASSYNPWQWWIPPTITQFLEDRVVFVGANMYAGSYTFTYVALVNSAGEFVNGPALAYDARQPELSGLSAGGTFNTKEINGTSNTAGNLCFEWTNRTLNQTALPPPFSSSPSLVSSPNTNGTNRSHVPFGLLFVITLVVLILAL
jgi:hypothetical protein